MNLWSLEHVGCQRKSNVSEKKRNRLVSRNRWKQREITNKTEERIYKKDNLFSFFQTFLFLFWPRFFFLWRENNKNGNISLRQIDMTLRDKKKIWTKQNWTQSSLIEEQLTKKEELKIKRRIPNKRILTKEYFLYETLLFKFKNLSLQTKKS